MKIQLASLALLLSLPAAAQTNLLTNGSFEAGLFAPTANQTMTVVVGSSAITGWTVTTDVLAWIGSGNPFGVSAAQGARFLDLTDYGTGAPFAGVQQSIATNVGTSYLLSFFLGSTTGGGLPVAVTAAAGPLTQSFSTGAAGTNLWTPFSLQFTASSTNTLISLRGLTGSQYIGLDNVSVVSQVPEPPQLIALALGLALVGFVCRRRMR